MSYTPVSWLTGATPLSADNMNHIEQGIYDIDQLFGANAAMHNNIFRGRDLINDVGLTLDEIYSNISDGTFTELYVGDYFDISITPDYTTETSRIMLGGFDTLLYHGDTSLTKHHAICVPKNAFSTSAQMNDTNTTVGAYKGSQMYTDVLPIYQAALEEYFGDHMLEWRDYLTTTINADYYSSAGANYKGCSTAGEWTTIKLRLMNEAMVYGTTPNSSSRYDTMMMNQQLPLFRLNPRSKIAALGGTGNGRTAYWLSAVVSSTNFAYCNASGAATSTGASDSYGVRPCFLIG